MPHTRRRARLWSWTLAWAAFVSSASCGADRSAGPDSRDAAGETPVDTPNADSLSVLPDSQVGLPDSVALPDTIIPDPVPADSVVPDSIATPNAPPEELAPYSGVPFGPIDLFQTWARPAVDGYAGTLTYASPWGILELLNSMRKHRVRGFLKMTGDPHETYRTDGRFDFAKWKKATARYDTPDIRAAVAAAVADGTLLGYSMLDEASRFSWNGSLDKAMLDRMAAFSKEIFPTLPTGAVVPYSWRPAERYKIMDVIITQTWKPTMTAAAYTEEAVAAAKQNGVALAVAINILAGPQVANCEKRPRGDTCLMKPDDVRKWALTTGSDPNICGVFMWRYTEEVWQKPAYIKAFSDVSAKLAERPIPSCRRPN